MSSFNSSFVRQSKHELNNFQLYYTWSYQHPRHICNIIGNLSSLKLYLVITVHGTWYNYFTNQQLTGSYIIISVCLKIVTRTSNYKIYRDLFQLRKYDNLLNIFGRHSILWWGVQHKMRRQCVWTSLRNGQACSRQSFDCRPDWRPFLPQRFGLPP